MTSSRYVVFDDAPKSSMVNFSADQIADALRAPLAAIGVRVVRQHGARSNSPIADFQARGWPRRKYQDKLKAVDVIVGKYTSAGPRASVQEPSKPK